MVAWCVKERESVNLFHCFRVVFIGLDSCVRGLLARFAQVFRRLKRAFVSTLRVAFSIVTGLVLVATCLFFFTARCSLTAFARKLVVTRNGL